MGWIAGVIGMTFNVDSRQPMVRFDDTKTGIEALLRATSDACQWFYECQDCHTLLKPKPGDCCVFCSYGSVPCPPIQLHGKQAGCCG